MRPAESEIPEHDAIVRDLRVLRERGLIRLRRLELPALHRATVTAGLAPTGPPDPPRTEELLRRAVHALGDEEPGRAAQYLFGLVQGTIGRRPTDLREKAADVYGHLSAETFRKDHEKLLIDRVAEEILRICIAGEERAAPVAGRPGPADGPGPVAGPEDLRAALRAALQHVLALDDGLGAVNGDVYRAARYGPFAMPCGSERVPVSVRLGAIQEIRDVDVLVSSENVYLDPSRPFTATISGQLRNAAARRDPAGSMVHDVVVVELADWVRQHSAPGRPVEPGLVVPTSSGALADQGVRRIYHAAVATPRPGNHLYQVSASAVIQAVHNCFRLARAERDQFEPPLRSITVPLFGAGSGAIDAPVSFTWVWPAIRSELTADPTWDVHLTTWRPAETAAVLRGLYRSLDDAV